MSTRVLLRTLVISAACGALLAWKLSAPAHDGATPAAITADGGRYYGELVDGRLHGKGRLEWDNGERYVGEFKAGLFSGRGVRSDPSGRRYEGQFVKGLYHGKGRYLTPEGDVYEGDFVRNEMSGTGSLTGKDGVHYQGGFDHWRFSGAGRYRDAAGQLYEGNFKDGQLQGLATITSPDGKHYKGSTLDWMPQGEGEMREANGDTYTGGFERGEYHGHGSLVYAVAQADGRTRDEGLWRHGRLLDAPEERLAEINIESALYKQQDLIRTAIEALTAPRAGRINLYLLSVAGDGNQEVFRREVDYVTALFENRFDARGHTLRLINSRNTGATQPMATRTAIEAGLGGIAARMDKSRDILFLFLTSHGSEDHELVLDQAGLSMRDLPAGELARMVRQTGIRWKVIVVSACYAGGFIDPLKDDHTLIITAARRDRRSFGCSDTNDFTYFGRAFFKESLPASASFQDAFQRASTLVQQWEREEISGRGAAPESEFSYPQMHSAAPIEAHLRRWWAQQKAAPVHGR